MIKQNKVTLVNRAWIIILMHILGLGLYTNSGMADTIDQQNDAGAGQRVFSVDIRNPAQAVVALRYQLQQRSADGKLLLTHHALPKLSRDTRLSYPLRDKALRFKVTAVKIYPAAKLKPHWVTWVAVPKSLCQVDLSQAHVHATIAFTAKHSKHKYSVQCRSIYGVNHA